MCGIAGYIGKGRIDEGRLAATMKRMINRGPDHQAVRVFQEDDWNVYLLHSRLSIIDLGPRAHQPLTIGDTTLIFNGEIYNYLEIRTELEKKGVTFQTMSDTEVLLQSYLVYGETCVDHFEGMWAFAIYDRRERRLFLSRDRFAEKPLYYLAKPHGIYFASEIKFLKSLSGDLLRINERQIFRYLVNGYRSLYKERETFFEDVQEVDYATNIVIDKDISIKRNQYWKPGHISKPMTVKEAIEGTRHHLLESMRLRLRSDVPLAFCLSGGVDSASLASIAAKHFGYDVATFSIVDQDERYNEYNNIKATIDDLHCKHTIIEIHNKKPIERLRELIRYHDAPVYTISYYVHSFLSHAISEGGYKVAISGTGADELFTGYYDHFNLHLYEMRKHPDYLTYLNDWKEYIEGVVRNPYLQNPELYFSNPEIRAHIYLNNDEFASYLKVEFAEEFSETHFCDSLLRNRMMNEMFYEGTRTILHEDDLNSMKYSVENRSPFLDSRLFNFAYSIPSEYLISKGYGKYILREAVKGLLNDQVRLDRQKKGFNVSINSIIDFNKKKEMEYLLDNSMIFDIVDKSKIEKLIQRYPLPNSHSKFLFNFINSKIFLEESRI
ncbi:MAG: asparagine synthase (glutamine-hydrolysing) [Nitrospirae bacterium]|nr:MAG: asparagine synthase (glutamine-hydrolysing) [Nitrospirota bacterium]